MFATKGGSPGYVGILKEKTDDSHAQHWQKVQLSSSVVLRSSSVALHWSSVALHWYSVAFRWSSPVWQICHRIRQAAGVLYKSVTTYPILLWER